MPLASRLSILADGVAYHNTECPDCRPASPCATAVKLQGLLAAEQASPSLDDKGAALPQRTFGNGSGSGQRRPAPASKVGPTEKQAAFLVKLRRELYALLVAQFRAEGNEELAKALEDETKKSDVELVADIKSAKDASVAIDRLIVSVRDLKASARQREWDAKKAAPAAEVAEVATGIYRVNEVIIKVYTGQSGRQLAKKLLVTKYDGETSASFEYAGLASRFVPADAKPLTLAEAKEYGAIYGVCCNCGRTLTDEKSIEAAIGPVCAKKFAA